MVLWKGKRVLGTTHRGRTHITSMDEIEWLEAHGKPYTRYVYRGGRVVRKVRRNVR